MMRVFVLLAFVALAHAAIQPAPGPEANGPTPLKNLIKEAAKTAAPTGGLAFFDKTGKQVKSSVKPDDFEKIPPETEAVLFIADPAHLVDAFLASAAKFATEHANFRVLIVNSAVMPIGGKKPEKDPNALPELKFIPFPKNFGVFGVRFASSKEYEAFAKDLEKDVPAPPSAAAAAPSAPAPPSAPPKKFMLVELKSRTRATWANNRWPNAGTWRYWFDNAFPNHHVSENTADNTRNHSTRNGNNWHYFGFTGTYSPATPVPERTALYNAYIDWVYS